MPRRRELKEVRGERARAAVDRRGGVLVNLATLGIQRCDRDQTLDYGRAALELARRTGSGVIGHKLRALQWT